MKRITIPEELSKLASITKKELIDSLGEDPFREVVIDICLGKNVRNFTETLTRTRLVRSNIALWNFFYINKKRGISPLDIIDIAKEELLHGRIPTKEKPVYQWLVALTGKQVQNVLRKNEDPSAFNELTESTISILHEESATEKNGISFNESFSKGSIFTPVELSWISLVIGSQTLTIRGSEKSLHGKYFEKLILGSVFQVLGMRLLETQEKAENGFFLSSQDKDSRESDCTIIYNSRGIRIDIGFIGPGNTEITLDKVSRYRKEDEIAGRRHEMSTIVIVDTIGERSKVRDLASKIEGTIFCMSDDDWVQQLSEQVSKTLGFQDPLKHIKSPQQWEKFLRLKMQDIDITHLYNI